MDPETSVLVTGATGNQGGAVVDHLLGSEKAFDVRGLTRDTDGDRARELADRGVTMVEGDLSDPDTLRPYVGDVHGVFAVTNFWTQGYDAQVQQGKNIADVAAEAGVDQFVFSGVGSHERNTGIPHFESAWEIEQHVQELELPTTVLQPVFFYQNFEAFVDGIVDDETIALPLAESVSLQMVDVEDLGRAAAVAFANPDEFVDDRFELAGDELTLDEMAEVLSKVSDLDVEPYHVPIEDAYDEFGEEFTVMCEWFNEEGYDADIDALEERFGFEFVTFPEYLRANGWEDKAEPAATPGWVKAFT